MGSNFSPFSPETADWLQRSLHHSWDIVWGQGPLYRVIAFLLVFAVIGIVWRMFKLSFSKIESEEDRIRRGKEIVEKEKRRYGAR